MKIQDFRKAPLYNSNTSLNFAKNTIPLPLQNLKSKIINMKKKTMIMLFALLGTMSANAQLLFRISGNSLKAPSYMMGTLHSLPGFLLDSIPTYHQAEEACQQFYSEVDTLSLKSVAKTRNKADHQKIVLDLRSSRP